MSNQSMIDGDNNTVDHWKMIFPVSLTASLAGNATIGLNGITTYDWSEQTPLATGPYQNAPTPRTGTKETGPFLVEINNNPVSSPPVFVQARFRAIVNGLPYYEFVAPPTGSVFSGAQASKTNQSIGSATTTTISWGTVGYDTSSYFNLGSDPTIITIPTTGYYGFGVNANWATPSSATDLQVSFTNPLGTINGHPPTDRREFDGTNYSATIPQYTVVGELFAQAGATLNLQVRQGSGLAVQFTGYVWISRRGS